MRGSRKRDTIEQMLTGGDPRSLGRTSEVVSLVLARPAAVQELFDLLFSADEIVRMRAGDALEKVCRSRPALLQPYADRLLTEVAAISQPSVQWHLAQMLSEISLDKQNRRRAIALLKRNLRETDDWIVTNLTLESMMKFAQDDPRFRTELKRLLPAYVKSPYKSVATRARKLLNRLESKFGSL